MENNKEEKNNKVKNIIILLLIIINLILIYLILTNIYNKSKEARIENVTQQEDITETVVNINNIDDLDLAFLKLENKKTNIVYSPLSIKYALGMLKDGSNNESKRQIEDVLGDYLYKKYNNNNNMSLVNSIFINKKLQNDVKNEYIELLKEKYNADVVFDNFEIPDRVNEWVKEKTLGLLDNIVDNIEDSVLILINALGVDMEWTTQNYEVNYKYENYVEKLTNREILFDNKNNVKTLSIGASINNYDIVNIIGKDNIKKMLIDEYYKYIKDNYDPKEEDESLDTFVEKIIKELDSNYHRVDSSTDFKFYIDDNIKVVSRQLKKYSDTTLEYIGIMPINEHLDSFIEKLDYATLFDILDKQKTIECSSFEEGKVYDIYGDLPLYKMDYELDFKNDLKRINITDVFDGNKADLSQIFKNNNYYVNKAIHKANIDFSYEGIKASAATIFSFTKNALLADWYTFEVPVEEIDLTFDKPFLFLIKDIDTGEVWFLGTVYEPTISE